MLILPSHIIYKNAIIYGPSDWRERRVFSFFGTFDNRNGQIDM